MSRALEILLLNDFRRLAKVYIATFPFSYARYRTGPADFADDLAIYRGIIVSNRDAIFRLATRKIGGYTALYKVRAVESFDEFKTIYFLSRAIERHLLEAQQMRIAQIHMFTMIGLLDKKLESQGVSKPILTGALTSLIRLNQFDQELGTSGCYLTYKCISTTARDTRAPMPGGTGD